MSNKSGKCRCFGFDKISEKLPMRSLTVLNSDVVGHRSDLTSNSYHTFFHIDSERISVGTVKYSTYFAR